MVEGRAEHLEHYLARSSAVMLVHLSAALLVLTTAVSRALVKVGLMV
jgi:hypothetical protein